MGEVYRFHREKERMVGQNIYHYRILEKLGGDMGLKFFWAGIRSYSCGSFEENRKLIVLKECGKC